MHTACSRPIHVVQRSAVLADPAIRLIVKPPPVSVRIYLTSGNSIYLFDPRILRVNLLIMTVDP